MIGIKKIIKISMLIVLMVVLAGCSFTGNSDVRTSGVSGGSGGSSQGGVGISFIENNPPSEMFKGENYDFAFLFSNYQMHQVDDLELKISGFDRGIVRGIPESDSISSIPAYSEVAGAGLKTDHFYEGVVVEGFEKEYPVNPKIKYCYSQTSFRKEEICVPSIKNVCADDIEILNRPEDNGALEFKILRVNSVSGKVRIDFEMTNSLNGRIVESCFEEAGFASPYDEVISTLGVEDGECNPTGAENFLFTNGKANFYCEFDRTSDESYLSQVFVSAGSLYEQETSLSITARDISYGIN